MAGAGKENKEKKSAKDEALIEATSLLRRLSDDLSALRSEVDTLKGSSKIDAPFPEKLLRQKRSGAAHTIADSQAVLQKLQEQLTAPRDASVSIAYAYTLDDGTGQTINTSDACSRNGLEAILAVDDGTVARLGYALSSAPKVAIMRVLLWDGPQSAAQLGEKASLTTGSLYHHLRELTHAEVIESSVRNRFTLTSIGRQTALILFVQAARIRPAV